MSDGVRTVLIVLNWNGCDDTLRCLASCASLDAPATIVVVDNGSSDDSVAAVRGAHPDVVVLETGSNLGFSAGNNVGIQWALDHRYDVIGILNNDTVLEPGFLAPLLAAIAGDPGGVAVSPEIRYLARPDDVWFAGARRDERTGAFLHADLPEHERRGITSTPALTGCALVCHRSVWERVGRLDEWYFLLFEDSDWSARAVAAGLGLQVVHDSILLHAVSATIVARASTAADYYFLRNGIRFVRCHGPRPRRGAAAFVADRVRDDLRQARRGSPRAALVTAAFQVRGLVDGIRGRGGPLHPGPVLRALNT